MYRQYERETSRHEDHRPHDVNPALESIRVVLAIKNFASIPGVCHIGLGVTAANTLKVLRRQGVHVEAWSVQTYKQLSDRMTADFGSHPRRPITHVIVSAPSFIQPAEFGTLCFKYPDTEFVQLNHSGCAFLSIDKFGIRNIRECIDLSLSTHNMIVAGNNHRFTSWASHAFGFKCTELPNLYDTHSFVEPVTRPKVGSTIRIGSFGAGRPWKNQLVAAEAAVELARHLGVDLELYVNSKRPDGGERMIESRKELFHNLPGCKLVEIPWEMWPKFRDHAARMHILFQPSFDETFNVVTADGIAEGIPSVTAPSIEWTPAAWQCEPCDPGTIVKVAIGLLNDPFTVEDGRASLRDYVSHGIKRWIEYLVHAHRPS